MKYEITLNGRTYAVEVEIAGPMTADEFHSYMPAPAAAPEEITAAVPAAAPAAVPAGVTASGECVTAPMPGNILKVHVTESQTVKEGDLLIVLEAMKMENEIFAPCAGTVKQVLVQKGATVDTGAAMVIIG